MGQPARRQAGRASTAISAVAATAKASSTSTARSARSSRTFPLTSSRQPTLKTEPSPRWSPPWPARGPRPIAARTPKIRPPPRIYPIPGLQPPAEPETRDPASTAAPASGRGRHRAPPIARRPTGAGRAAGPADGHSPACVAPLPAPPRCRAAVAAAIIAAAIVVPPSLGGGAPGEAVTFNLDPAPGIGAGGFGHGGGPARCFRQLGYHLDCAAPQNLRRFAVVRMLVCQRRQSGASASGVRWHVPRSG